jgi:hypothetical protein
MMLGQAASTPRHQLDKALSWHVRYLREGIMKRK